MKKPGAATMLAFVLAFSSFGIAAMWIETGSLRSALGITAMVLPFVVIAGYFATRKGSATVAEKRFARAWLIARRFACFAAAVVFGAVGLMAFLDALRSGSLAALCMGVLSAVLAALAAWSGAYGAGTLRSFSDDKSAHEERKARYGWK